MEKIEIPLDVLENKNLSSDAKLLFGLILKLVDGISLPCVRLFSYNIGISAKNIHLKLEELKRNQLINIITVSRYDGDYRFIEPCKKYVNIKKTLPKFLAN
jgi:hypothetical protein